MRKWVFLAPVFLLLLVSCIPGTIEIKNVRADVGLFEFDVSWDTSVPTNGQVMLCNGDICVWSEVMGMATHHQITITDIEPGERYKITIVATAGNQQGIFEIPDIGVSK
jgi:hypothetical protein